MQGVGFRPTVFRLAQSRALTGFVRNDDEGVWIEIEGAPWEVRMFAARLKDAAPPLSRIESIESLDLAPLHDTTFEVQTSARTGTEIAGAALPADTAPCEACLRELFDPTDRRYLYPFINCTDCGPRYTIAREVPYDRERTTMSAFPLCAECRAEYEDPTSRRFHAEPNACPECGPRLELRVPRQARDEGSPEARGEHAVFAAIDLLREGAIVAVKGLGGYLLAVDATNEAAVARLRERKRRPHKPFAVMARDLDEVRRIVELDPIAEEALRSPARPIVLARSRTGIDIAPSVAPGLVELGVMLPSTPLHHLLLAGAVPMMVMTSGNAADEPIARTDLDAEVRLKDIADALLVHDREIHARADDSVVRVIAGAARTVRRSRGFVPTSVALGAEGPPVLGVGAELKSTVCLTRRAEAVLSAHIGDLENAEALAFFTETIERLQTVLGVQPVAVAHDLHPDYASTRWALHSGLPRIPVQHHHAHIASCLAEHGRTGPVIGVAFDGTGCGPSGELWGGELLIADLLTSSRFAHLRPLALIGGETAIRQPWRLAVAALVDADEPLDLLRRIGEARLEQLRQLMTQTKLAPRATGAGRWFDAVAALCGIRDEVSYDAQAAIELEAICGDGPVDGYPFLFEPAAPKAPMEIDLRPTIRTIASDLRALVPASQIAARLHETMSRLVVRGCEQAREAHGLEVVALSGGCFQNRRLTERTRSLLAAAGFEVLLHREVPCNDGGISLGQAAVAAARLRARTEDGHVSRDSR